ncbi:uncharacterized protein LACBIDRAFT_331349 [Laccaria bicolor S238N-H82]|uniref:Predicted protein n=1 Tax=Laccaria bicolor (strain S238N-H82 / ATCC MYA-4686) TaxID=486041 RepID=B0DP78_LACBS|nr:uncharacterized protein LACBIDRAFT_331349 [Laccaria bicolor S238N-H82]EDR03637.1 predicted protein [Laccaria bicolor S238N-H82]|eukprot:XP_001885785.1 predicted protein [Laccaria bicolor S238N-H82]
MQRLLQPQVGMARFESLTLAWIGGDNFVAKQSFKRLNVKGGYGRCKCRETFAMVTHVNDLPKNKGNQNSPISKGYNMRPIPRRPKQVGGFLKLNGGVRPFCGRRYVVLGPRGAGRCGTVRTAVPRAEAWRIDGDVEGFLKLNGGALPFCGRRYVVLGPGGVQNVVEQSEKVEVG